MNPSARGGRGKPTDAKKKRKSREELNVEARDRKRQKKRRGLASGSRSQEGNKAGSRNSQSAPQDSRIGSKKPVPLVAGSAVSQAVVRAEVEPLPRFTPEQELKMLENDDQLDALLYKLEQDEVLSVSEQAYVDETLDRIDALMTELGIEMDDDEDDEPAKQEDILQLLKRGQNKDRF